MTKKSKAAGATTVVEKRREAEFKSRLQKFFPSITNIQFAYTALQHKGQITKELKNEGSFGYKMKESVLVNNNPIKISWIPHIKDSCTIYLDMIIDKVVEEIAQDLPELKEQEDSEESLSVDCRETA